MVCACGTIHPPNVILEIHNTYMLVGGTKAQFKCTFLFSRNTQSSYKVQLRRDVSTLWYEGTHTEAGGTVCLSISSGIHSSKVILIEKQSVLRVL